MKANVIGNGAVVVALCAAITLPLTVWHNGEAEARARAETLRQQKEAIKELTSADANRKKAIAGSNADALTDEQMRELLRLRAEAGALRKETNNSDRLGTPDAAKLTPEEQAQRAQELSSELLDAARRIVAELPEAKRRFGEKQGSDSPPNFPSLRSDFPTVNGKRMPGLYSFGFIRGSGPKPGDNLLLTETGTHETADGKVARTFAFADGHAEEVVAPDRESADAYFTSWVKENWGTATDPPSE